ncbi:hypothetical protein BHM03_00051773 [Ensete ventricosum]|nr:hypothetical protein BHM03_00051773 [Ensete ventricosum]
MRRYLVGSSLGDSPKESGSSQGTRREIAGKKTRGHATILPEVAGVCGRAATRGDTSRGGVAGPKVGRPLAGRLPAAKGSRRLRRGSDGAVRVKES